MDKDKALVVFQGNSIRRTWHDGQWYFVALDIVGVLTDSANPSDYLKKLRKRDDALDEGWGQIVTPLKIDTPGGAQNLNCVNTENAFRLIQSIPSKKAEPFKRWLAKVGYTHIQEIENPELAQDRVKKYYELKGYPKEWIDKRLRGIAIRQELTDEWKGRGVTAGTDFAILTDEITHATFGKTVNEYKKFKGLEGNNPLRDHMTDWELILTMVGEKATTDITVARDAKGFDQCEESARDGGQIASNTRKELEQKTGRSVVSSGNFLGLSGERKRIEGQGKKEA
jgi:DNA-damage-inducible protein D